MKLLSRAQRLRICLIRFFDLTSLEDELGGHMHKGRTGQDLRIENRQPRPKFQFEKEVSSRQGNTSLEIRHITSHIFPVEKCRSGHGLRLIRFQIWQRCRDMGSVKAHIEQ